MFQEGADMFHLYGLINLFVSIAAAALFIYLCYKLFKRRKKGPDKK